MPLKYAAKSSEGAAVSASQGARSPGGWFAVPFAIRLWIALALVITASIFAFLQSPRPDAFRRPPALLSFSWWRYPLEWNAPSRLPKIGVGLNAVYAGANSSEVWAVGNNGMVVSSADGITWTQRGITKSQVSQPASRPQRRPPAKAASLNRLLNFLDPVPAAQAADLEPQDPRQQVTLPTPAPVRRSTPGRQEPPPTTSQPTPSSPTQAGTPESTSSPSPPESESSGSGSSTWDYLPESESLVGVYFYGEGRGEAISGFGTRYLTGDGGKTWQTDSLPGFVRLEFLGPLRSVEISRVGNGDPLYHIVGASGFLTQFGLVISHRQEHFRASFVDDNNGWLASAEGVVYRTQDEGKNWQPLYTQSTDDLHGIFFLDKNRGWVAGANGIIRATNDGGVTWTKQDSGTQSRLNAISFHSDGQRGWIVGEKGSILSTTDGGNTWIQRTQGTATAGQYVRLPAPWFFLVALLAIGLTLLRRTEPVADDPEESVADLLVSDRPLENSAGDVLAFNSIALGLSRFLRNENTVPPLTIAMIGEWGTGKSSLMNLLRSDLRAYKFRPVWFNAWHHQKEEHMLASLLENIKLQAVPRWWTPRGIAFRAQLLKTRGIRHWLPLCLLLSFVTLMFFYQRRVGASSDLTGFFGNIVALFSEGGASQAASRLVALVPLLAGVVTFLGAVWRGMTAFGVKPASLLADVSSGASIRGLEAQTSFRHKFAVAFNDVTKALGKRSLLIFIDDLDRCRPENVLETLEAVNFLTTSGECFVVIGMAREYVERCVGRAFKDIAEEMIDEVETDTAQKQSAENLAKEKRIEFARQYLDKLINIEVPVPTAKQPQSLNLLLAGSDFKVPADPKTRWQEFSSWTGRAARKYRNLLQALSALVLFVLLGYLLAYQLPVFEKPKSDAIATVTPTASRAESTPSPAALGVSRSPTPTPTPNLNERAEVIPGANSFFWRYGIPLMIVLGLGWLGLALLERRPDLVVKDSPNFVDALTIWHPLIYSKQSTPRKVKRFMNRVRFLAMRQRRQASSEQSWFHRVVSSNEQPAPQSNAESLSEENAPENIPDEALVALAAIEHFDWRLFSSMTSAQAREWPSTGFEVRTGIKVGHPSNNLLIQAREAHEKRFGKFDVLQYRERFVEMTASVKVR